MLFHSTYAENLKYQNIRVELGKIRLGECGERLTYQDLFQKADALRRKAKLRTNKIGFNIVNEEVDEFGHRELFLEVYYERKETRAEYYHRIKKLQVKDLQEFYQLLARFNVSLSKRKEIKEVFDRLGSTESTPPYWMKEMLEEFFNGGKVPEDVQREINGIYSDAVKYPQLALPNRQLERLRRLVKNIPEKSAMIYEKNEKR